MFHYRLHRDPKSSHQQIARIVRRLQREPILDVGAAQGILAQLIQGTALTIDAIEVNAEWAQAAQPFYRQVYNCSVEDAPLEAGAYGVIVCGDILEHTVDPLRVLTKLRQAAQPDAYFVISLPNVAHLAVRLMLLAGQFPAMERGILDRTHLHFYTLDSARKLLEDANLRVIRCRPTGVPLDELWPRHTNSWWFRFAVKLQHVLLASAPRLFGFQWILLAQSRLNKL